MISSGKLILAGIILLISFNIKSQDKSDFKLVEGIFQVKKEKTDFKVFVKENPNEFQLIASGFFIFYKSFFSSQDGNHCVFHPSCSVYTIQSIKKRGIFMGIIDGMDRLQRCNRLSPENYERYENTNLLSDPID